MPVNASAARSVDVPPPPAPLNSVAPHITGTPSLSSLLAMSVGAWSYATSYSYQWFNNGVAIGGATASTYQPVDTDLGQLGVQANPVISGIVTGHGPSGSTAASADNTVQFSEATVLAPYGFVEWQRSDSWQLGAGVQIATGTDRSGTGNGLAQATAGFRPTRVVNDVSLFAARFVLGSTQFFTGPLLSALLTVDGSAHGTAFWALSARLPTDSNADAAVAQGYNLPGQGVGRAGGYAWLQSLGKHAGQLYVQTGAYSATAAAGKGAQGNVTTGTKTMVEGWLDSSNKQIHLRLGWNAQIDGDIMADTIASVTDPTVWGAAAPGGNYLSEDLSEMFVCRTRPSAAAVADVRASLGVRQNVSTQVLKQFVNADVWANGWDSVQAYGRFYSGGSYVVAETTADTFDADIYMNGAGAGFDAPYMACVVGRDDTCTKVWFAAANVDATLPPANANGTYRITINLGGVPGSLRRIFLVNGGENGGGGYQFQRFYVDVSKTWNVIAPPVAATYALEGTGGLRLSQYGWVCDPVGSGVLSIQPAAVTARTNNLGRIAAMGPSAVLGFSLWTNEATFATANDVYTVTLALIQALQASYGASKVGWVTLLRRIGESPQTANVRAAEFLAAQDAGLAPGAIVDGLTLVADADFYVGTGPNFIHPIQTTGMPKMAVGIEGIITTLAPANKVAAFVNSLGMGSGPVSAADGTSCVSQRVGTPAMVRRSLAGV